MTRRWGWSTSLPDLPKLPFKPGVHVHYQETVLPMKDGLPKMKDLPAEMGGSGTTLPGVADNEFAIVGGTGRYAGARGTYLARRDPLEFGGDGTASFEIDLTA